MAPLHDETTRRRETVVLLTCVCYNDLATVRQFLRQTLSQVELPAHCRLYIALSDNSHSCDADVTLPASVSVYRPEDGNIGYLGGCAFAFRRWVEEHARVPDWTGIVNTDIAFDPQCIRRLVGGRIPEDIGIVAPDIRLRDGTLQNPFMRVRPSRLRMLNYILSRRLFLWWPALKTVHRAAFRLKRALASSNAKAKLCPIDEHVTPAEYIYAPHGSAIFLRKNFFDGGATLEYDAFLYMEEIHLAEQARRVGLKTAWMPSLKIAHCENTTTSKISQLRRLRWEYQSARVVYRAYFSSKGSSEA